MANLTRDEMVAVINRGESIILKDPKTNGVRIISRVDDLPSEAELARSGKDAGQIRAAQEALAERIRLLQAEHDSLEEANFTPPPKAEEKPAEVKVESPVPLGPGRVDVPLDPPKADARRK
jgi:hypothetical protein